MGTNKALGSNIGPAIGCRTWITDPMDHNKLAPIGTIGELIVEGPNIAQGYLKDEKKTHASFLQSASWQSLICDNSTNAGSFPSSPAGQIMDRRLYKMGDLVKYLPNGNVQFIGRKDSQIKLRGQRIELGEIEHQLRQIFPQVTEIAVEMGKPADSSTQTLISFMSLEDIPEFVVGSGRGARQGVAGTEPAQRYFKELVKGVKGQLSRILPPYMIPSFFVPLWHMPLTASAKTDRKILRGLITKLTVQEHKKFSAGDDSRAPSTAAEIEMQALWQETLGKDLEAIGADDNFFQIGGDSIAAMRLVANARSMTNLDITVEKIFRNPLLSDMAKVALTASCTHSAAFVDPFSLVYKQGSLDSLLQQASTACGVDTDRIEDIYPTTPLQDGLMALSIKDPGSYVSQFIFGLPHDLDIERFQFAWEEAFQRASTLRTRIIQVSSSRILQAVIKETITWDMTADLQEYLRKDMQNTMGLGLPLSRFAIIGSLGRDATLFHSERDAETVSTLDDSHLMNLNITPSWISTETSSVDVSQSTTNVSSHKSTGGSARLSSSHTSSLSHTDLDDFAGNLDTNPSYFVFTAHHAIYDGWSIDLLFNLVEQIYLGLATNPITEFNIFIRYLQEETDPKLSEKYWSEMLTGATPTPFHVLQSKGTNYQPCSHAQLEHKIRLGETSSSITLSTKLRAAWSLLLTRYVDSDDVMFATTVSGRTAAVPGIDNILSPTFATIPVRVRVDPKQSLGEYLDMLQRQSTEAMPHEQFGLQNIKLLSEDIKAACQLQTLLIVQSSNEVADQKSKKAEATDLKNSEADNHKNIRVQKGLGLRRIAAYNSVPFHSFAMSMECTLGQEDIALMATYDSAVFEKREMQRFLLQLENVFEQVCVNGVDSQLVDINIVSLSDKEEIASWNLEAPYLSSSTACLHGLVEDRARLQPDEMAVCSWEGQLTYRELNNMASHLAEVLGEHGVSPRNNTLVPLLFEKSIWTIVSMLAILKAGGACVALDPAHPVDRLQHLVERVDARLLLSSRSCFTKASTLTTVDKVLAIDEEYIRDLPDQSSESGPDAVVSRNEDKFVTTADHTAFILFTSGSTGQPKGIIIDHSAFASSINGHASALQYRKGSRNLQYVYIFAASFHDPKYCGKCYRGSWAPLIPLLASVSGPFIKTE